MRKLQTLAAIAAVAGVATAIGYTHIAFSADHLDSPAVVAANTADIADVYSWMDSTGKNAILAMTIDPTATATSLFDTKVQYVLHTASGTFAATNGGALPANTTDIIATFTGTTAPQAIHLWVGTKEYVTGDASKTTGLVSADKKVTVFAGPRADAFFFNLEGFHNTQALVKGALGSLTFNDAGCPTNVPTGAVLTALSTSADGGKPSNSPFGALNEMAIVVQLDKTLLTAGGTDVAVWGATYK